MNLDFQAALAALGPGAAFQVANAARPAGEYLFNTLLPEQNRFSYDINSGSMTVRPTMAGLVGMDSPYPPGGVVELSTFVERTAKIANRTALPEQTLRAMQDMLMRLRAADQLPDVNTTLGVEALNFLAKVILQPHMDTMEWLRAQALVTGAIDWTFGQINLTVDYGLPAANLLTARTGNDGYGGSASKFWDDVRLLRARLRRGGVLAMIANPETIDMIRFNTVNGAATVAENADGSITLRRFARTDAGASQPGVFSEDTFDTVRLVAYGAEAEILDLSNPGQTLIVPFMPTGKILAVGRNVNRGYRVGQGATTDPNDTLALGYTHIAPTVEGGGRPGRWADLFTPENEPWSLVGRAVTNGLPVIENPELLAVATTDMV